MVAMALISFEMITGMNVTNMTKGVGFAIGGFVLGPIVGAVWLLIVEVFDRARRRHQVDEERPSNVHHIQTTGTGQPAKPPRR